jgi:hypothetical protein
MTTAAGINENFFQMLVVSFLTEHIAGLTVNILVCIVLLGCSIYAEMPIPGKYDYLL